MLRLMKRRFWLSVVSALLVLQACGGSDNGDTTTIVDPGDGGSVVAHVAGETEVTFMDTVTLDAGGSSGPEGETLRFFWSEDAGNPPNNFLDGVDMTEQAISFIANVEGTFTFSVTVSDTQQNEDTASITFTVERSEDAPVNFPPQVTGAVIAVMGTQRFVPAPMDDDEPFVIFTTGDLPVDIELVGFDEEGDFFDTYGAGALETLSYARAGDDVVRDTDGFHDAVGTVWLDDNEGGVPKVYTVDIRVVPKLGSDGFPFAYYVDCAAETSGSGTWDSPFNTIQEGYDAAKADTTDAERKPDVYVATGVCEESVMIGLDDVALYGQFVRGENWRRRTNPDDRQSDALANITDRFAEPTIIRNPAARHLMHTPGKVTADSTHSFYIDGFSFELDGENVTALNMWLDSTLDASRGFAVTITNNTFTGRVTDQVTAMTLDDQTDQVLWAVGGGISIIPEPDVHATVALQRNLFQVEGRGANNARFQASVYGGASVTNQYPRVFFYGNVFHGGIGGGAYRCRPSGNEPFAFCFYRTNNSDASYAAASQIHRNLFYVTDLVGTGSHVLVDLGNGRVQAGLNVIQVLDPDAKAMRFFRVRSGDDANNRSVFAAHVFPLDNEQVGSTHHTLVFDGTAYTCISTNNNRFGTAAPNLAHSGCTNTSAHTSFYSGYFSVADFDGSDPIYELSRPWRIFDIMDGEPAFEPGDAFMPDAALPQPHWDFDGRYGPDPDTENYSPGAFEPFAPLY